MSLRIIPGVTPYVFLKPDQVMELIEKSKAECRQLASTSKAGTNKTKKTTTNRNDFNVTREVGKIAFNVIVSRGISYSLGALLGARA